MEKKIDKLDHLFSLDKGGMLKVLSHFPFSCKTAIESSENISLSPIPVEDQKAVVIAGIGGSAIGGCLLNDWLNDRASLPILSSIGYNLPGFVDEKTLVIAVSYSGNTKETLNTLEEAIKRKCPLITLTSGGLMKKIAEERKIPCFPLPKGIQPRAALPYQFFTLAALLKRLGLLSAFWDEVEETISVLRNLRDLLKPETDINNNPAKSLALGLMNMIPFIFGPSHFKAVAYRFKTQLNENSKVPAGFGFFPEVFHNAVMGCEGPESVRKNICVVLIRDCKGSIIVERRVNSFKELVVNRFGRVLELHSQGQGRLARMFSTLYIGDYASTYLGLLYGFDPSSVESILALKGS